MFERPRLARGQLLRLLIVAAVLAPVAEATPAHASDTRGDTLVVLSDDVPAGLDYDGPGATTPSSQAGFVNLMEPLLEYARGPEQDGVGRPDFTRFAGRLAERWSFDPATLTWTFTLRRGVRSCAGNELTADDVVYTFARAKSVSGAAPIGWFLASTGSVAGFTADVFSNPAARVLGDEVQAVDRYTVRIRQSEPNVLLLPVLTTFGMLIFDARETRRHATPGDPWSHAYVNNVTAPGFGPYCLERWSQSNEIVYRANPGWSGGRVAIPRVVVKRIPQSSNRYILMRMGEAHLAERLTPKEFDVLRRDARVRVVGITGNETLFVHMNFGVAPFDRPAFRRAIAAAVPYERVISTGYLGQAKPWRSLVPSSYPGYVPADTPPRHDPAEARRQLALAGFPDGRGLERYATALRLIYPSEKEPTLGPIATVIRSALREVGIPVDLEPIPQTLYGDRQLVKKDMPFALNDVEKPVVVDAGYAIKLFFVSAEAGGVNNMVRYSSPVVDALWSKIRVEADPSRRALLLADAQRRMMADLAWLPVVEYRTQWALDPRVRGLAWYPDNAVRFATLRLEPAR
jgi:peptide/nickel transport system substrate-binding protein